MLPILFWVVAVLALVAAATVVVHRRPAGSVLALLALLLLDAVELFLIGAPLLAVELLVIALAGGAAVWAVLVRGKREKLGAPGMARYTLAKLVALLAVIWLAWWLGEVLLALPERRQVAPAESDTAVMGGLLAVFLLGSAAVCVLAAVRHRRAQASEEPGS